MPMRGDNMSGDVAIILSSINPAIAITVFFIMRELSLIRQELKEMRNELKQVAEQTAYNTARINSLTRNGAKQCQSRN